MQVNGTTLMTVQGSTGNVGIATTPDDGWNSNFDVLQIGTAGVVYGYHANAQEVMCVGNNFNQVGASFVTADRINEGFAQQYLQDHVGQHVFRTAVSAAANASVSWINAMLIDNAGKVGIGTEVLHTNLDVVSPGATRLLIHSDYDAVGGEAKLHFKVDSQNNDSRMKAAIIFRRDDPGTRGTGTLHFAVNGANSDVSATTAHSRMVINATGNVGIGTTSPGSVAQLHVKRTGDGTVQRMALDGVCEWDWKIGNTTAYVTGGSSGDLELMPLNGNMGFAVGRAGTTAINMRVRDGKMTLGTGIAFNGDTAAANELDDYEEGTFTPVIKGYYENTSLTVTQGTRSGYYTKIGNVVHIRIHFDGAGIATSGNTDIVAIGGLPFAVTGGSEGSAPIVANVLNLARTDMGGWNNLGAQELGMLTASAGGGWGWELCSTFATANVALRIQLTYRTAT